MCELDPDVVRWGLHLIDVCSLTSKGSPQTVTCYEKDLSTTDTVNEGFCSATDSVVENDEVIAHALQEELSRLSSTEASGFTSSGGQNQEASILAQEWLGPSGRHSNSGLDNIDYCCFQIRFLSVLAYPIYCLQSV